MVGIISVLPAPIIPQMDPGIMRLDAVKDVVID
jgi:hypothetical protein